MQAEFPRDWSLERPEICRLAPCIMVHYLANRALVIERNRDGNQVTPLKRSCESTPVAVGFTHPSTTQASTLADRGYPAVPVAPSSALPIDRASEGHQRRRIGDRYFEFDLT